MGKKKKGLALLTFYVYVYRVFFVKVNLKMLFYGKLKMSFFRHPPRKYLYLSCGMKGH